MDKDRTRLTSFIALAAMAVLSLAVPVHHAHMLLAALERPVQAVAPGNHAVHGTEHVEVSAHAAHRRGVHGQAVHVEPPGAHHHHAQLADASAEPQDEHPVHEMPRCPICSTVQAAAMPVPSVGPVLALAVGREAPPLPAADIAPPSAFHFRPVQPRAPPIAG